MQSITPQRILYYVNLARMFPTEFSRYIQDQLDSFKDQWCIPLQAHSNYRTNQGKSVWKEAIQFMKQFPGAPLLQFDQGLNFAAQDHVKDMVYNDMFDHTSSDGTPFSERLQKRCGKLYGRMAQCLGTEFYIPGRNFSLNTVLGLIIDDGDYSRNHRKSLLSKEYNLIGASSKVHKDKIITVIDLYSGDSKNTAKSKLSTDKPIQSSDKTSSYTSYVSDKPPYKTYDKPTYTTYDRPDKHLSRDTDKHTYTSTYDKKSPNYESKIEQRWKDEKYEKDRFGMDRDLDKFELQKDRMQQRWKHRDRETDNWKDRKFDDWKDFHEKPMRKGQRYVVSQSTSTKTSTVNGVKKTITTKKLTYSDGNTEEIVQQSIT